MLIKQLIALAILAFLGINSLSISHLQDTDPEENTDPPLDIEPQEDIKTLSSRNYRSRRTSTHPLAKTITIACFCG